jgi:erythronate-4-phosphate dehydrogenase
MRSGLRIAADKNIPHVEEAFGRLGSLLLLDSGKISPSLITDRNMLLVRYVTRVDNALLAGTSVKFVGTVSAGTDHVDLEYLKSGKIGFSSAPGSNAESVAEYVTAALLWLHERGKIRIPGGVIGVVGAGNVGSRVAMKAKALGMKVLLNDPPKHRATGDNVYRPLSELMRADVITLHTPLTFSGRDKTAGLFDAARLSKLKSGAVIINTARGGIVREGPLKAALASGHIGGAVLDVWMDEPNIDHQLAAMTDIATPHVAGLSREARGNALSMIYSAACEYFGMSACWSPPPVKLPPLFPSSGPDRLRIIGGLVKRGYDIERDSCRFKRSIHGVWTGSAFNAFRGNYSRRTEFGSRRVKLSGSTRKLAKDLIALGFCVS